MFTQKKPSYSFFGVQVGSGSTPTPKDRSFGALKVLSFNSQPAKTPHVLKLWLSPFLSRHFPVVDSSKKTEGGYHPLESACFWNWQRKIFPLKSRSLHPGKPTCPIKRDEFDRKYIFQPLIFRGHLWHVFLGLRGRIPVGQLSEERPKILCTFVFANHKSELYWSSFKNWVANGFIYTNIGFSIIPSGESHISWIHQFLPFKQINSGFLDSSHLLRPT